MDITLFFGRFHPLLVHLPIGFLLLAVIIEITERYSLTKGLKIAVPFILLLGTLSGVAACILGLMLATGGDYNEDTLSYHKWAGITTTVVAGLAYAFSKNWINVKVFKGKGYEIALGFIFLGLAFTGHLGGNLTHGADYLTEYMPFKSKNEGGLVRPKVTKLEEAQLFGDIVHPIIKAKCMNCHNQDKLKGELSFSSIESYVKGGKHGNTIVAGDALKSELLVRVNLDHEDKKFMPTDGKTPLTDAEKTMLTYWIQNAKANYDTLFLATKPDEKMVAIANNLLQLGGQVAAATATVQFAPVDANQIKTLTNLGFTIRELSAGSNAFDVVLPSNKSDDKGISEKLKALLAIKDNILWLTLEQCHVQNADLATIANFKNVRILKLSKNDINDESIDKLKALKQLESINLYKTNITTKTIDNLADMTTLKTLYVWQTQVDTLQIPAFKAKYKNLKIVSGS